LKVDINSKEQEKETITMALPQISPSMVAADTVHINQVANNDHQATSANTSISAQKTFQQERTDTVTISRKALQKLAAPYSPDEEAKETPAQKAHEKFLGKK
jgi:hypothetical protein